MTALFARLLGRMPIGWLQLTFSKVRLATAVGGVAFANILVFMQLGFMGALIETIGIPYAQFDADILLSPVDANTLTDGGGLPRERMFQALSVRGIAAAAPLYVGRVNWRQADGTSLGLDLFGIDPAMTMFQNPEITEAQSAITAQDRLLLDRGTRNLDPAILAGLDAGRPYRFELNGRSVSVIGTFMMGGGITADGYMVASDQTFFDLFPAREAGAPDHIAVRVERGADVASAVEALQSVLPGWDTQVRDIASAVARDRRFQTTQKPVGLIFGFGVVIGILVGITIVYQVLSTDVADHIREYATFKAIGYRSRFFLGIVFEEALLLAAMGFVPGLLISVGLYAAVSAATGLPVHMTLGRAASVLAMTIAMCALSGAIATRRLTRADPADLF